MAEEETAGESEALLPTPAQPGLEKLRHFRTYKRRWFLLGVVCLLNCSNATLWLTFAPVADQAAVYFNVSLDTINWLSVLYLLISIPFGLVATWLLDTAGLKCTIILSAWLNMIGCVIRAFSIMNYPRNGIIGSFFLFAGQSLCALAQPLIIFSPTKLAALWFPDHQRAIANTISSMSNPLGMLIANLVSPALVSEGKDIPIMLGIYAIPAVVACILAVVGIHDKVPPTPPSASATNSTSQPFFTGLKMLMKNKPYIILAICFGAGIGIFTCFSALLEQILCVKGYSNFFAGLNGALFIVFGLLGAFLLGLYVDRSRRFIETTKICFGLAALASIVFAVMTNFRNQTILLALSCSLFGFFGFSVYPVAMELAVECSFPVGEGTSSGLIFVSGQIQGVIMMKLMQALTVQIPKDPFSTCAGDEGGTVDWINSTLGMAGILSAIACFYVIFFHTDYRRLHAEAFNGSSVNKIEDKEVIAPEV
ncbi:PREDICTED: major facilitator superfamily domain-containing protein 7 [Crocodylus porosus]|uniref:major facilitator superfamily domain-containing protein 7 n=1 Tax=Crocodylus porosus TaxID=8502 RepID=UPI000938BDD4|nr:PREDICTED: major facilitator superfamily domain-containing protein 7 [Crocodylus porosus]